MSPDKPFDPYLRDDEIDDSGTPVGRIDQALQMDDVVIVDAIPGSEVLVECPMESISRERLGRGRFVALRNKVDGKHYALVRHRPPQSSLRRTGTTATFAAESREQLIPYPEEDPVGRRLGLEGAGIMAYQTGDQMHPPMVNDEMMWSDARRWREGACEHTRAAARLIDLHPGERVLDIGCGICGPARTLVDEFGVKVFGIANAEHMLATARTINARKARWRESIAVVCQDCQEPFDFGLFDVAWSMNMIYRVPDKRAMLRNIAAALRPGGRLLIEDWMFTNLVLTSDRHQMERHHYASGIPQVQDLESLLNTTGFAIRAREDLGIVGRTHLAKHFIAQFNAHVRPLLERDFPEPPMSGAQMAEQWMTAVKEQIRLYREEKLTYLRLVALIGGDSQTGGGVRL